MEKLTEADMRRVDNQLAEEEHRLHQALQVIKQAMYDLDEEMLRLENERQVMRRDMQRLMEEMMEVIAFPHEFYRRED